MPGKLVLVRHGQSIWNLENLFTGWIDVDLYGPGPRGSARRGPQLLKAEGFTFDIAFTSVLKRAIRTLWIILDEMDLMWLPVERSWRLNERHYGALQGLDKAQTVEKHGAEQVKIWRRSYDIPPPPLRSTTSVIRASIAATRACDPRGCPRPSRSRTRSRACCRTGTSASRPSSRRAATCSSRARQQPARAGEDARRRVGRATSSSSTSRPACRCSTSSTRASSRSRADISATRTPSRPRRKPSRSRPRRNESQAEA